jgi:SAM-dependent methyltransferase
MNRSFAEAEKFVDKLTQHLNFSRGSRLLDLACGAGRHAIQFRNNGFEVIGIDLSEESISEAQNFQRDGLEFFVHDMRSLYWDSYFDVVVNLFTSFGYFHNADDDQSTIQSIADSLKPEGVFVLDFMNAVKVIDNLVDYEEKTDEGVRFEISRSVEDNTIIKHIHVVDGEVELDFEERVDALRLADFLNYFETAGLQLLETFGDYDLNPFDEGTSDRLILIARK